MNEEKLGKYYQRIAEVIVETIPDKWSKVYLYGEVVVGSQTAYFLLLSRKKVNYQYTAMTSQSYSQ